MLRLSLIAMCALLVACTEKSDALYGGPDDSASALDTGLDPLDDSAAEDSATWAQWFSVGGTWTLAGGLPQAMTVELGAWAPEPGGEPLCVSVREATLVREVTSPDPTILGWWLVDLGRDDAACALADEVPRRLILGLGALHPEMAPALDRYGLQTAAAALYGAFAAFPDNSDLDGSVPYAYGFAGTSSDRAGDGVAVEQAPMPDGAYVVTPVYLLAIPGAAAP